MVFEAKMRPLMEHIGKDGYITNKAIMSMLETVAGFQSDEVGFGILDIDKNGVSWVQLEWKIKVLKRPKYGECLLVKTWGRNTSKISTYRDYELYNENNELCVIATTKWILVDVNTKKITKITDDIIGRYIIKEKCVFDEVELDKLTVPEIDFEKTKTFEPKMWNIDVNGHVHNLDYIDFAYETMPIDAYNKGPYNNIRISYKKEVKLGDIISSNYAVWDNKHTVVMNNEKDGSINCIVQLWD